jgi:RNA polymerase sigma-70 factor (ECF subfamily)
VIVLLLVIDPLPDYEHEHELQAPERSAPHSGPVTDLLLCKSALIRQFVVVKKGSHRLESVPTKPIPGTLQEGGTPFQTTHWTVVFQAGQAGADGSAQKALSIFCEAYWAPLYTFVRRRGYPPADAQDLIQGFFEHLFEQNALSRADQEKGRLRTFLLSSLQNFIMDQHGRAQALKRGGGQQAVSLDQGTAEAEAAISACIHLDDVSSYDLTWASTIAKRSWQRMQTNLAAEGKAQWLSELKPFVDGAGAAPPNQRDVAERLGVPIATLRTWLARLRHRYREILRAEVASTVSDPASVDQELRYLHQILLA